MKANKLVFNHSRARILTTLVLLLSLLGEAQGARGVGVLRKHETSSRIPVNKGTTTKTAKSVCSSRNDYQFERSVLLTFKGRPGYLRDSDVSSLQQTLMQAYGRVADCSSVLGGFWNISRVIISRDIVESFGSTISRSEGWANNLTQHFTFMATVDGACRGCSASPFALFSTSKRERSLATAKYAKKSLDGNRGGAGARQKIKNTARPRVELCVCSVPSKSAFIRMFNAKISTNKRLLDATDLMSVDKLVDITELSNLPCSPSQKIFQTFVTATLSGGILNLTKAKNAQTQYRLLEQAILQSYNDINSLGVGEVCDPTFITVTDVHLVGGPGSSYNGSPPINLSSSKPSNPAPLFERNYFFSVKASCRGCKGNPPALFNGGLATRRMAEALAVPVDEVLQLGEYRHPYLTRYTDEDKVTSQTFHDSHIHRRLPVVSEKCFCPINAAEFRTPTSAEFTKALNSRWQLLKASKMVTIAAFATNVIQDTPVNCSANVSFFEVKVNVGLAARTNSLASITTGQATKLTQAFASSYNSLAQKHCDPLFRTVESVQLVGISESRQSRGLLKHKAKQHHQGDHRSKRGLAHSTSRTSSPIKVVRVTLSFTVRGRCRGCTQSTSLYNDATSRALLEAEPIYSETEYDFISAISSQSEHRTLQTNQNSSDRCYCDANSIGNHAPSKQEFLTAYNQTLSSFNASVAVVTIVEHVPPPQSLKPPFPPTISPFSTISVTAKPVLTFIPNTIASPNITSLSPSPTRKTVTPQVPLSLPLSHPSPHPVTTIGLSSRSLSPSTGPQLLSPFQPISNTMGSLTPTTKITAKPTIRLTLPMPGSIPTSSKPSATPTRRPTSNPIVHPSKSPIFMPTLGPFALPSESPSVGPSKLSILTPSAVPSSSPTTTPSSIPSPSPSTTPSSVPSSSPSTTPSFIPSPSPSTTPSSTPSSSPSTTPTSPPSSSPSTNPSSTPSLNPSTTPTSTPSSNPSTTPTSTPSSSPSALPSTTPSSSPSATPTSMPSARPTSNPTAKPTAMPTSKPTPSPTSKPTSKPTLRPSKHPTLKPTVHPTRIPTLFPTLDPTAQPTANPTREPTLSPTSTPSFSPTSVPTWNPSSMPSALPSLTPSSSPSGFPTFSPSSTPSALPTSTPSLSPSAVPTLMPSSSPSSNPSALPSWLPSFMPSAFPSYMPSSNPSVHPSALPTSKPTTFPSNRPTLMPTQNPTSKPTSSPSTSPTPTPSARPTTLPTASPTSNPSAQPTLSPTSKPSASPTSKPTTNPTLTPSASPTGKPTASPTGKPTSAPTGVPTSLPTPIPTAIPTVTPTLRPTSNPTAPPS